MAVLCQPRDPIALPDAARRQQVGDALHAVVERRPGERDLTAPNRDPCRRAMRMALEDVAEEQLARVARVALASLAHSSTTRTDL